MYFACWRNMCLLYRQLRVLSMPSNTAPEDRIYSNITTPHYRSFVFFLCLCACASPCRKEPFDVLKKNMHIIIDINHIYLVWIGGCLVLSKLHEHHKSVAVMLLNSFLVLIASSQIGCWWATYDALCVFIKPIWVKSCELSGTFSN